MGKDIVDIDGRLYYKCPRCRDYYVKPMTKTGFCVPCNYEIEENRTFPDGTKANI